MCGAQNCLEKMDTWYEGLRPACDYTNRSFSVETIRLAQSGLVCRKQFHTAEFVVGNVMPSYALAPGTVGIL